jgi:hypothetical protein
MIDTNKRQEERNDFKNLFEKTVNRRHTLTTEVRTVWRLKFLASKSGKEICKCCRFSAGLPNREVVSQRQTQSRHHWFSAEPHETTNIMWMSMGVNSGRKNERRKKLKQGKLMELNISKNAMHRHRKCDVTLSNTSRNAGR